MDKKQEVESFVYVKQAIDILKQYWRVFAISITICLGGAFFANWYIQPQYEVSSVILISKGDGPGNMQNPNQEFMKSFSIFKPVSDVQSEIMKMKSSELVYTAIKKTNMEISYFGKKGIKEREMYSDCPFIVEFANDSAQLLGVKIQVEQVFKGHFNLKAEYTDKPTRLYNYKANKIIGSVNSVVFNKQYAFGEVIHLDALSIRVIANKNNESVFNADTKYYFMFNDMNALTYSYQKMLDVEQVAKEIPATSIKLKVKDPQKGIDFITALTDAYLHKNIDEKNSVAENTITFFDEQLSLIGDSLQNAEKNLQNFQSNNKILQISNKADQIFKGSGELETQKADLEAKDSYYHFVLENLENNNNSSISVPSSAGVNDPVLNGIIEEYLKLNSERNNLIKNDQSQSPYYNTLNIKINNLKNDLLENVKLAIGSNNVHLKSINTRLQKTNAEISQLPKTQRELVGIERKYRLNDNVYTYMLQKKAEAQVAKASNIQEQDILEVAKLSSLDPVSPNRPINLIIGMFMGLFIPFIFFGAKAFMDDTISGDRMVESITNLPTIGTIYHRKIKAKQASVMIEAPRSAIAESVRAVRMNAQYRLQASAEELTNPNNLILVTSSNAGEGKSFVSLNLAVSFSLLGKKTILLDFDLRKPNNVSYFKAENELGISSIISGQAQLKDIRVTTGIPNFEYIPAGTIPPNPAELIGSELTTQLIEKLKLQYDYVIIDTPPVGLVSDAYLLMKNADLKIMVIREKVTPKGQIVNVFKEIEEKNIKNVCWLLNDVDITKTYYGVENEYFDVKG